MTYIISKTLEKDLEAWKLTNRTDLREALTIIKALNFEFPNFKFLALWNKLKINIAIDLKEGAPLILLIVEEDEPVKETLFDAMDSLTKVPFSSK